MHDVVDVDSFLLQAFVVLLLKSNDRLKGTQSTMMSASSLISMISMVTKLPCKTVNLIVGDLSKITTRCCLEDLSLRLALKSCFATSGPHSGQVS